MRKKPKILALFLIVILGLIWWVLSLRPSVQMPSTSPSPSAASTPKNARKPELQKVPITSNGYASVPAAKNGGSLEQIRREKEQAMEASLREWRTPMEFYGRVLDENEKPISGATIEFIWNDISEKGTSEAQTLSDDNGLFSLTGKKGKGLSVKVYKDGYYTPLASRYANFEYGDPYNHFVADAGNPVIFNLRKKGKGELLTRCRNSFRIQRDGNPVAIDLFQCRKATIGTENVVVQCWTDDQGKERGQKYDWKCRISVPGGGIVQTTNEFDFEAPLEGYQPADQIDMLAKMPSGWRVGEKRKYFFKLPNGIYGRMVFEMRAAGDHFFEIESLLNPSGSRNLEAMETALPKQQLPPGFTEMVPSRK